jgi:SAM-dependent methyltransferase
MRPSTTLALFASAAYLYDVVWRPHTVAAQARLEARKRDKPLLNVGAGTKGSSFRSRLLGPTLWGDVNVDIEGEGVGGPDHVGFGDAQSLNYPDKHFGATVASHVLEHVDDPIKAMRELARVTDGPVFVITPPWWAPHTWMHLGHRWFLSPDGRWFKLWDTPKGQRVESSITGLNNALVVATAARLLTPY